MLEQGDKVYTLAQTLAVRRFGRVSPAVVQQIRSFIQELTEVKLD